MENQIDKLEILSILFYMLADELESTNTFFQNNSKQLKKLFNNYGIYDGKKQLNTMQKIYKKIEQLKSKKIQISTSNIIRQYKKNHYTSKETENYISKIIGNGRFDIYTIMDKVLSNYANLLSIKRKEEKKLIEDKKNVNNITQTNESSTDRTNTNREFGKTKPKDNLTNQVKNINKYIRKNEIFNSENFVGYSENIKKIIQYLMRLKHIDFKMLSPFTAKSYENIIVELIYLKISLKAKEFDNLTNEEKIILKLLNMTKYDPLNILKTYEKKKPEYFSYSEVIKIVNEKLKYDINEKIRYINNYEDDYSSRLCYNISVMTSLMSVEEIGRLYRQQYEQKIVQTYCKDAAYDFEKIKIFQILFATAIINNPNYKSFSKKNLNNEQLREFRNIEISYICVDIFKQLPAFLYASTKEKLCEYIIEHCPDKTVANLMVEKIMNKEYVNDTHHRNLEIYNNNRKK